MTSAHHASKTKKIASVCSQQNANNSAAHEIPNMQELWGAEVAALQAGPVPEACVILSLALPYSPKQKFIFKNRHWLRQLSSILSVVKKWS